MHCDTYDFKHELSNSQINLNSIQADEATDHLLDVMEMPNCCIGFQYLLSTSCPHELKQLADQAIFRRLFE